MFTQSDFLHVCENRIVNENGKVVILRGTNLGGWLHREGWMDGCGACLLPITVKKRMHTENGICMELDKICRCNRLSVTGTLEGKYKVSTSLDGVLWSCVGKGSFSDKKSSTLDHLRPVPYAPGVNTYDEGTFLQENVIHTDEFFGKFIRVEGKGIEDAHPMRYGDVDDYSARKILEERFGSEKAENLLKKYQKCYITKKDLEYIRSLGFNFVRIPIYWQEILNKNGKIKENAWVELDWVITVCRELELYIMLDYHGAPGGNTMGSITAGQLDSNELWKNKKYQEFSQTIWKEISSRYKNEATVACYDLLNEPCADSVTYGPRSMEDIGVPKEPLMSYCFPPRLRNPVRKFYKETYHTIRSTGDRHIVCMQQFLDMHLVEQPEKECWNDVMFQVHCYPVGDFRDHLQVKRSMQAYVTEIQKNLEIWKVPVLVGEFCFWEYRDVWEEWMKELNAMHLHWANWSYKITDPVKRDNWSLFYDFSGNYVDYLNDSCDEIARKWSGYDTKNYKKNDLLEEILERACRSISEDE